jgi:hypothetical protein
MTGLEPWVLFGESMALSAHARYAKGEEEAHGQALFGACRDLAVRLFGSANGRGANGRGANGREAHGNGADGQRAGVQLDYPAAGALLFALGAWVLLRRAAPPQDALRLLALADRFSYNRTIISMMWERIVPAAEEAAPGQIAGYRVEYRDRQPSDLLDDAFRLAERLPA